MITEFEAKEVEDLLIRLSETDYASTKEDIKYLWSSFSESYSAQWLIVNDELFEQFLFYLEQYKGKEDN